jgi:hypothetical protein
LNVAARPRGLGLGSIVFRQQGSIAFQEDRRRNQ